ncbi:MAG TPA: HD domain-containing phosphohydrolase, partial [Acidobacteriaceae bacterium]|nr:HD domain-containing phosphohydrolase [Acidobacteriaceae bacterium]
RRRWRTMSEERILVVDEDPYAQAAAADALGNAHYRPAPALSGEEAAARLEAGLACDLILYNIKGCSPETGKDAATIERLRDLSPDIPVVVISTVRDVNVVIQAMRAGASDYLLKPFAPEQLLASIQRALQHRHAAQRNAADKEHLERLVTARTDLLRQAIADLEQAYDITLEALGDALDLKDAETEGHSRRVTAYTIALARAIGLKGEELRIVSRGAFLHDIGKMAIPDAILLKPGKLDRQEQAMMREHCARGYQILRKIPFLQDAAQIVYSHQERFDGTGYPRRLKGDQIILGARIFSVADTLDAITSDRPYRRANSFEAARREILRCAGTQFDPDVVEVFQSLPNDLWENLQIEITHHARVAALTSK